MWFFGKKKKTEEKECLAPDQAVAQEQDFLNKITTNNNDVALMVKALWRSTETMQTSGTIPTHNNEPC